MNEQLMNDPGIKAFVDSINSLKDLDDSYFTDEAMDALFAAIDESFSSEQMRASVNQIIQNFEAQGASRVEAMRSGAALKEFINQLVYGDGIVTGNKKKLLDKVIGKIYNIFDVAFEKYHIYAIELPVCLEEEI